MMHKLLKIVSISIFTLIVQIYFPMVYIGGVSFSPDLVLILITYFSIIYGRFYAIIFGFILGFFQDLTSHVNLIGIYTLTKSISGYLIGSIFYFESIWSSQVKGIVIFCSYFVHFFIYFYFVTNDNITFTNLLFLTFLQSVISFIIFKLLNNLIFNRRII